MSLLQGLGQTGWLGTTLIQNIAFILIAIASAQLMGKLLSLLLNNAQAWENYQTRLKTWWLLGFVLATALYLGPTIFILLWALIASLAIAEINRALPLSLDRPLKIYLVSCPLIYALVALGSLDLDSSSLRASSPVIALFVLSLMLPAGYLVLQAQLHSWLQRLAYVQWLLIQMAFFLGFFTWLSLEAPCHLSSVGKAAIPLWVILTIQLSDAMQYCVGRIAGSRPIAPKISPRKTWEGFIGGIALAALLSGYIATLWTRLSFTQGVSVALLVAIAGFFGDLIFSAIKREALIKDFSDLLKGHGGLVDRLDSLIYGVPVAYYALHFLN